ncbi:hypothetical protein HDU93_004319 [Gonapodya sp. JEL0774]|nr:hypothetical protein HDU93_004319 [Gonapodya sp. JEL0774]
MDTCLPHLLIRTLEGSNNKLNEQSNGRNNANRLFDSQNNGNGGYQVGDACVPNCLNANTNYNTSIPGAGQGIMQFYEGSELTLQWSAQHGCGMGNPNLKCEVVIQYTCDDSNSLLRDGYTTNTIPTDPNSAGWLTYGQHEPLSWYQSCVTRQRNKGLFTADQNLQGDTAQFTRQNNNGQRFGFECPEERDYYPYWHPSPWRDIFVCTGNPDRCSMYQRESQNVNGDKGVCSDPQFNQPISCARGGATWMTGKNWNVSAPDCWACEDSRVNHLGNTKSMQSSSYTWRIPEGVHPDGTKCVVRFRYNTSSLDFDGWNTFALYNGANSPVTGNPAKDFVGLGANVSGPLRLNINTAQFFRTFEDRSHVFIIRSRPADIDKGMLRRPRIVNLNVRGRRGNIVQVYPSVEYDFVPTDVSVALGDYLHVQWTGSDANDRGNNGNGKTGTDRSNIVLTKSRGTSFPVNVNPNENPNAPVHFTNNWTTIAFMAYLNQTKCDPNTANADDNMNCKQLNAAPAYVNVGLVRMDNTGVFNLMSTRNDAFTNRDQKGTVTVTTDAVTAGASVAIGAGGLITISGAGFIIGLLYTRKNPTHRFAHLFVRTRGRKHLDSPDSPRRGSLGFDQEATTWFGRRLAKFQDWWEWNESRIVCLLLYLGANIAIWVWGYVTNLGGGSGAPYFPFAKGFGKALDFNCSFILLPVLRNVLSWLRTTPAADAIPLDDNILMHKLTALFIFVCTVGHVVMHYLDFAWSNQVFGTTFLDQALNNLAGATGHLVLLLMSIMFVTALISRRYFTIAKKRYDGYAIFLWFHKLWMPTIAILILHGPPFWIFVLWPLAFLLLEKLIQSRRAKLDVALVDAKMVNKEVMKLTMAVKSNKKFSYKAGQYLYLCCPDVTTTEWHPFTITSAPEEPHLTLHIRCRPEFNWTPKLRDHVIAAMAKVKEGKLAANTAADFVQSSYPTSPDSPGTNLADVDASSRARMVDSEEKGKPSPRGSRTGPPVPPEDKMPTLKIDGPYGSASEEVFDYNTVVLVGAGIGVTPFASVIKSINLRTTASAMSARPGAQQPRLLKVYFYWICRDVQEFESFKDLMWEVASDENLSREVELNTYTTGELDLKRVNLEKWNQFSGRPNWNRILKEKALAHKGEEVGVFLCGPGPMAKDISNACVRHSKVGRKAGGEAPTVFRFHKENF